MSVAMNFPNDETGQVLTEMHQAGIDLLVQHEVVFFHLFEKQEQAQAMADHIKALMPNVHINVQPDESPNVWDANCTMSMIPSYENVMEQESTFEKIAETFKGYSDGWGIEA